MEVVEKKPVPIYEVKCHECKSRIRYKACEVSWSHIACPVCGVSLWASAINAVDYEPPKEEPPDDYDPCYECGGYGDDYRFDKDGELVSNCPDCPFNEKEDA